MQPYATWKGHQQPASMIRKAFVSVRPSAQPAWVKKQRVSLWLLQLAVLLHCAFYRRPIRRLYMYVYDMLISCVNRRCVGLVYNQQCTNWSVTIAGVCWHWSYSHVFQKFLVLSLSQCKTVTAILLPIITSWAAGEATCHVGSIRKQNGRAMSTTEAD